MMKAWVLHGVGDIRYEDVDIPAPAENEVRIRVKAAGICGSDIPRIYEMGAHKMPLIPGHEFSGVVEGIGKETQQRWLGKRVAVYPKIPCGKCRSCLGNMPDMCLDYDYIGSRRDGAFAEYMTAPMANLLILPDSVSFEEAAMLEPFAVAADAVRTGVMGLNNTLAHDKPVAVCGLGTIGVMAVMLLLEAGFKNVYVIGNKASQKKRICSLGIPEEGFFDSTKGNASEWLKEASDGGVQAYFECVGKNECILYGLEATAPGGRMVLVGNPHSDMNFSRETYWLILRKQLHICGIWNSHFAQDVHPDLEPDDWNYVLQRITDKRLKPEELITHRFKLKELEQGLRIMKDKKEDYCKVMALME